MATSGTYAYGLTLNQVVSEALELIQAVGDGETLSGDHVDRGTKSLNGLLKEWQTQGIHLWTYTEGSLFLVVGQEEYDFRLPATRVVNTYYETTTAAATAALATSFTVASASNLVVGDPIGIIQSNKDMFWTTIETISGTTVTIPSPGITLATTSGSAVRNYRVTETLTPVARMLDVRRKEGTDYEIPIIFESRKDYFNLPNKSQTGTPIQAYYSRQDVAGETSGIMYLWNSPDSSIPVINFTYERKIQIMVNATDTLDVPDYAHDAVIYNLARKLIPKFGCSPTLASFIIQEAETYKNNMLAFDSTLYPIKIQMKRNG
jgi:hypothetical protein